MSIEIMDKELLEQGKFPDDVLNGDGKIKLNVGSFLTMWHHGWINIDVHDLEAFAKQNGYKYMRHDVRAGLPFQTGSVSAITAVHMLEHLTAKEGMSFLRECRRVLSREGAMRLQVPDAGLLMDKWQEGTLGEYDEINEGCSEASTSSQKLWELLHAGHSAIYDAMTLKKSLEDAGFIAIPSSFREVTTEHNEQAFSQIQRETLDTLPCITLVMDSVPHVV